MTRRENTLSKSTDRADGGVDQRACDGCSLADRRTFLTQAAALIAGAMVGLGMTAERVLAMPVRIANGVRMPNGDDVSFPIPAADGATIDRDNDLILARYHSRVYAFGLACPHQNTALRRLNGRTRS